MSVAHRRVQPAQSQPGRLPAPLPNSQATPVSRNPRRTGQVVWPRGKLHRHAEAAGRTGREGEGPVVRADDAVDDRQTEADAGVVGTNAFRTAPERLDEPGDRCRGERFAGVLDLQRNGRVRRQQRLALSGRRGTPLRRGGVEVRLARGSRPLGCDSRDVGARVGRRGRPRAGTRPRTGCRNTAPRTGCAASTATNRGTTNCGPRPRSTVARPCTPTRRTTRACSDRSRCTTRDQNFGARMPTSSGSRPRTRRTAIATPAAQTNAP